MESYGQPQRIHASEDFKHLLDGFGSFTTELRGVIEVKVSFSHDTIIPLSIALNFFLSNRCLMETKLG